MAVEGDQQFARGVELHRAGRLPEAEAIYERVIRAEPRHHQALFSLSVLALTAQRNEAAAELLTRATALDPGNVAYQSNLGEAYRRIGRLRDAGDALLRAVSLRPDFAVGFYNLALVLQQDGQLDAAVVHFERAVDLNPGQAAFQQGLGEALRERGEAARAAGHLLCAWLLSSPSARPEGTFVSGSPQPQEVGPSAQEEALRLERQGDLPGALRQHEIAVDARPRDARFHLGLARALRSLGALSRSVAHYHSVLALDARKVDALVELSGVLEALGRVQGAGVASLRAVQLDPSCAMAHATLAAAYVVQSRYEEAVASCRRALALDPSCWLAHFHMGYALAGSGAVADALSSYRRAVELRPDNHATHSALLFLMSYAPGIDAPAIGAEARAWARLRADPLAGEIRPHDNDRDPERRLRVGYVSPDLHDHPVALFLQPLLESFDRERVEVLCYSSVRREDAVTARLRAVADGWRDVFGASDAAVADRVREDRVDILVDLTMHASGGRPLLFARKPAPVQVCWLAYVGTTGLSTMDYRTTDPHLEPPGLDPGWSTESPLVLPETFWCYAPWPAAKEAGPLPEVGPLPAASSGRVTFGSQHSIQKVNEGVLSLWARVLREVEGARLVMYAPPGARGPILRAFERSGVDPGRIEFVTVRGRREYLWEYRRIDVCLDTFPCNGATSSLDAFWMGVPVVTLVGQTPPGRAGLSIATNLGMPELVARTEDDYVRVAVGLARDLGRLSDLRAGLRDRMGASPLMDAPRFAANVERAYRAAWKKWAAGSTCR